MSSNTIPAAAGSTPAAATPTDSQVFDFISTLVKDGHLNPKINWIEAQDRLKAWLRDPAEISTAKIRRIMKEELENHGHRAMM